MAVPARARRSIAPGTPRTPGPPARKVAPARVPPTDRRHLRVVSDARVVAARKRRRLRAAVILSGLVVASSLFALAAFHAMLASGQARLDEIESQVSDAQARYESLRLQVAELEAPSRIVREAQERLGMVPPPGVTYLTPSEAVSAEVGQAAVDPSLTSSEAGEWAAWATVKPYLSGRP
jgi:cell division protein FtsL